jgi:hypothetical protein
MVRILHGQGNDAFDRHPVSIADLDPFPHRRIRLRENPEGVLEHPLKPGARRGVARQPVTQQARKQRLRVDPPELFFPAVPHSVFID